MGRTISTLSPSESFTAPYSLFGMISRLTATAVYSRLMLSVSSRPSIVMPASTVFGCPFTTMFTNTNGRSPRRVRPLDSPLTVFPSSALPESGSRGPGPHPVLRNPPPTANEGEYTPRPTALVFRQSRFPEPVEEPLLVGGATERTDQALVTHRQPRHSVHEFCERDACVIRTAGVGARRRQDGVAVDELGVPFDGQPRRRRGLRESFRGQVGPAFHDAPDHHEEIARRETHRFGGAFERALGLAAERVDDANVAVREARVRVELDGALETPERLVVTSREELVDREGRVRRRILIVGRDGALCDLAHPGERRRR